MSELILPGGEDMSPSDRQQPVEILEQTQNCPPLGLVIGILRQQDRGQAESQEATDTRILLNNMAVTLCDAVCQKTCRLELVGKANRSGLTLSATPDEERLQILATEVLADQAERYDGLVGVLSQYETSVKTIIERRLEVAILHATSQPKPEKPQISDGAYQLLAQKVSGNYTIAINAVSILLGRLSDEGQSLMVQRADIEALFEERRFREYIAIAQAPLN